jgi:hypothetical protein
VRPRAVVGLVVGTTALLGAALAITLHARSTFASPQAMLDYFGPASSAGPAAGGAAELPDWQGSWSWSAAPFRYRVLFHGAVDLLYFASRRVTEAAAAPFDAHAYWLCLVVASIATVVFAGHALFALMRRFVSAQLAVVALLAWFALPPIHYAYVIPIQTKEDFLGYGLFFLGLAAILDGRWPAIFVFTALGALTRETLLAIPLLALVRFGPKPRPIAALALGGVCFVGVRLALGWSGYSTAVPDGLAPDVSATALFVTSLFLILGAGWVGLLPQRGGGDDPALERRRVAARLLPVLLVALVGAHVLVGRVQETRISALLAPWAVLGVVALVVAAARVPRVRVAFVLGALAAVAAIVVVERSGLGTRLRDRLNPGLGEWAAQHWWQENYLQLVLTAGLLAAWAASALARERSSATPSTGRK